MAFNPRHLLWLVFANVYVSLDVAAGKLNDKARCWLHSSSPVNVKTGTDQERLYVIVIMMAVSMACDCVIMVIISHSISRLGAGIPRIADSPSLRACPAVITLTASCVLASLRIFDSKRTLSPGIVPVAPVARWNALHGRIYSSTDVGAWCRSRDKCERRKRQIS